MVNKLKDDIISIPEYVDDDNRNEAHYFINMLLKSLPLKKEIKNGIIDNVNVKLIYNKTKLKRESDFQIDYNNKFYSTKFLHSDLHHYSDLETNWLVSFVLNHKKEIEDFIL